MIPRPAVRLVGLDRLARISKARIDGSDSTSDILPSMCKGAMIRQGEKAEEGRGGKGNLRKERRKFSQAPTPICGVLVPDEVRGLT